MIAPADSQQPYTDTNNAASRFLCSTRVEGALHSPCNYVRNQLTKLFLQPQMVTSKVFKFMCMPERGCPSSTPQSPVAWPQRALPTHVRKGTATLREVEKGKSWWPRKTLQLLPEPVHSGEHRGEPTGRCGTSVTAESLRLSQAVQQEGLKQPWCGWRDGSTGMWFGAQDPWVTDAFNCLTGKLPPW